MSEPLKSFKNYLAGRLNLQDDREGDEITIESIRKNIEFKGVNLWTLIFAIFIASIGLNVNSTAVIIGAMLISPIMGPIMGIGLGIGVNDLELVKKGARSLFTATLIGIITSAVYFAITPLHEAQSELLARTSPSIWDVFIAFFGGLAGMVGASRKEKTNVIPGVAIATALMPPLCTVGYGIATGNWYYCFGALYLYSINSVFIAIATYLMVRYLKIGKKQFDDSRVEKRVHQYMVTIVVVTVLPSIYLAYKIVDKNIFESNARKFLNEQFVFPNTQVVTKSFVYDNHDKSINVLLFGEVLPKKKIDSLKTALTQYKLKGVNLNILQGLDAQKQIDLSQIKTSILQEVYADQSRGDTAGRRYNRVSGNAKSAKTLVQDTAVFKEVKILYPAIQYLGVSKMKVLYADTSAIDTTKIVVMGFRSKIKPKDQRKLQSWLRARYQSATLKLLIQ